MKLDSIIVSAVLGCVAILAAYGIASPQTYSFTTAKKKSMEIALENPVTLYCGCRFDADKSVRDDSCGYVPRRMFTSSGDVNLRTSTIEWEHVVPASRMGQGRKCWEDKGAFPECQYSSGKWMPNQECCRRVDPEFKAMEADMHNLWPAIGELNGDRSDKEYGSVAGEPREYGACDFEVSTEVVEPSDEILGEVARAYLYMEKVWGLKFLEEEQVQYRAWNMADPPTEWELERERRITEIQGVPNTFVRGHTHVHNGKPCTPRDECCRVCSTSKPCGNACISESKTCLKEPGCACAAGVLCPD